MRSKDKTNTDDIDEEFLLATFRDDDVNMEKLKSKAGVKRKKNEVSYSDTYFKRNDFKKRGCVYISEKNHEILSTVVRTLADKDITVGGYIDLILSEHIEQYKEEIKEVYREKKSKEESRFDGLI